MTYMHLPPAAHSKDPPNLRGRREAREGPGRRRARSAEASVPARPIVPDEPITIDDDPDEKTPPTRIVEMGLHLGPLLARYKAVVGKELEQGAFPHLAARARSMASRRIAKNRAAKQTRPDVWLGPAPVIEIERSLLEM